MNKNSEKRTLPYWRKDSSLHFAVGLVLSLTLVTTAFEWNFRNDLTSNPVNSIITPPNTVIDLIVVEEIVPSKPKVPDMAEPASEFTDPTEPEETEIPVEFIEVPGTTEVPDLTNLFDADYSGKKEKADEAKYELIPASPKEGMDQFYQYLYKNIRYPIHLTSRNVTGQIEVTFVVDIDGKITDVKILKGFDKALEKEIIRVLENSRKWEPAQLGPDNVRTQHRIPFSFNIQ